MTHWNCGPGAYPAVGVGVRGLQGVEGDLTPEAQAARDAALAAAAAADAAQAQADAAAAAAAASAQETANALGSKLDVVTTVEPNGKPRSNEIRWRDAGFKLVEAPGFVTGTGGTNAERQARAVQNTLAADAWIAKWTAELEQDHRRSTLILPDSDFMMAALPRDNAHFVGSAGPGQAYETTGGRSSHCLFLNALNRPNLRYGTIECGNGRLVRDANDVSNYKPIATPSPGTDPSYDYDDEPTTGLNAYDSCLYVGGWKGLNIKGLFRCIGYREDYRRGAQSGSGVDASYGTEDLYVEGIQAELGTNSVGCIGTNRRGPTYTVGVPVTGYDTTRPVKNVYIGSAFAIGGEHAIQVFIQDGFHCEYLRFRRPEPFFYQGVQQTGYMQRGIYAVSGNASFGTVDLGPGPAHVAVFMGILQANRNPADLHLSIERLIAEALPGQDVDLHSLIGYYDQNDGAGAYRQFFLNIDSVKARGYKRLFSTQDRGEAGGWFDETKSPLGMLRIGHIDAEVTSQGLSIRPYGGGGPVVINTGRIKVLPDPYYSTAQPVRGVEISGLAEANRLAARANPMTKAQIEAVVSPKNRQHFYCTDWPAAGGGTEPADLVYETRGPAPANAVLNRLRKLNTPGQIEVVDTGSLVVVSGNAPGLIAGARTVKTGGNRFTFQDVGVVDAERRCLQLNGVESQLPMSYWTSDGLDARQQYRKTQLPVVQQRFGYRDEVRTAGIGPVAAGARTTFLTNFALTGVRFGDRVEVASTNQNGLIFEAYYKADDVVDVFVRNPTGAAVTGAPNSTFRIYYYGAGPTLSTV